MPIATSRRVRAEGGAALIIVLTCLVLVAGLAIALLNRVEADRSSSAAYKGGANSRNLSEYAVNVVMAQIAAATTGANAGNAWASQPGAIRVFDSSGSLVNIYKLYSSQTMVTGTFPTSDTNMTGWSNSPALYTDLNAPLVSYSGYSTIRVLSTNYPILDPGATNSVQGFAISGAPNPTTTQPAPMPVTWLYVLQDGTLVAPTAVSTNTVGVTGATAANPITGRIAFWTDDETCKVNINTAAGMPWTFATNTTQLKTTNNPILTDTTLFGNYWDTPLVGSYQDEVLCWAPPWRGEYQRFPGHPATVSLSAVFTNLTTNDIMAIAPRINYGTNGSQWGDVKTYTVNNPSNSIPNDGARLYANVDELFFGTNTYTLYGSPTRTNNVFGANTPSKIATQINRGRFFLTASSRAPDVTLFNTPRILCWPVNTSTIKQTPYDKLIAFDGTVGNYTYYFTRGNAYSPTADYSTITRNQQLLTYLKNMTTPAVPGFGGAGILGKYGADSDQIRTEIFDYIRCINLQDNSVPGAGNTYWYSTDGLVVPIVIGTTMGFGRMPTVTKAGLLFWYGTDAIGDTTHTFYYTANSNNTTSYTLCARLVLENFIPAQGYPAINNIPSFTNVVTGLGGFQWAQTNSGMAATPIFANTKTNFDLMNLGPATMNGVPGGRVNINGSSLVSGASNSISPNFVGRYFTNISGGALYLKASTNAPNPSTDNKCIYNSGPVIASNSAWYTTAGALISSNGTNAYFTNAWYSNGTITSTNYSGCFELTYCAITNKTYYGANLIQTINGLAFPAATNIPLPPPSTNNSYNGSAAWAGGGTDRNRTNPPMGKGTDTIQTNDVVRSIQVAEGDYRMTAAQSIVDAGTYFTNHPGYLTSTNITNAYQAHAFAGGYGGIIQGFSAYWTNYYTKSASTWKYTGSGGGDGNAQHDMITNKRGGVSLLRYGDFDNSYGNTTDGPNIGFCDEGMMSTNYPNTLNAFQTTPYFGYPSGNVLSVGTSISPGYFSPNRLVPSAGILGSLPTGVMANNPWQTLLFRPAALTGAGHPGANSPPDYLLLDLFNMPVVEPYAISEPLSTAGRINMNYQILPFTWIKRSTAVQAALHTERLIVTPDNYPAGVNFYNRKMVDRYKDTNTRLPLNLSTNNGTLVGFENRFTNNGIFVSASEICSIPLVPTNSTYANITIWWNSYNSTGDNARERPYARIYPKLTTKSNVYTVHYTVQALKKLPSGTQTQWDETKDKVLSTYRGSTTIERYVNPRDSSIPDYTGVTLPLSTGNALPYKFRILSQRQFSP